MNKGGANMNTINYRKETCKIEELNLHLYMRENWYETYLAGFDNQHNRESMGEYKFEDEQLYANKKHQLHLIEIPKFPT